MNLFTRNMNPKVKKIIGAVCIWPFLIMDWLTATGYFEPESPLDYLLTGITIAIMCAWVTILVMGLPVALSFYLRSL